MSHSIVRYILIALGLVALSTLPYVGALDGGFFYDDWRHILDGGTAEGPVIRPLINRPLPEMLERSRLRALTFLTYRWDFHRGGGNPDKVDPRPFHHTNLLIHGLAVLAVWGAWLSVGRRLEIAGTLSIATLSAALFGAHPLATEAVNYPTARGSSLVALFTFAFVGLLIGGLARRGSGRWAMWLAGAAAAFLSAYSKEVGVLFPCAAGLGALYVTEASRVRARWTELSPRRRILIAFGPPLFLAIFFCWMLAPGLERLRPAGLNVIHHQVSRTFAVEGVVSNDLYGLGETHDYSVTNFWLTQCRTGLTWLSMVVAPWGRQTIDHAIVWSSGPLTPWTTLPAVAGVAVLALFALVAPLRSRGKIGLAALGIWITFVGLGPNSFTPGLQLLLEYRYVTGLAGATLALGSIVSCLLDRTSKRWMVPVCAAMLLPLAAGTLVRNIVVWRDGVSLWSDAMDKAPNRLRARNELAMAHHHSRYRNPERAQMAIDQLHEIRRDHPDYVRGLTNLGNVLAEDGRTDEAIEVLEQMLDRPKVIPAGVLQLGLLYERAGRNDDAIALWREATRFEGPHGTLCMALWARLAAGLGRPEEVTVACERFWERTEGNRYSPLAGEMAILHTSALFQLERLDAAMAMAERAEATADTLQRKVRSVVLRGDTLEAKGRFVDAGTEYDRAIDLALNAGVSDPTALEPIGSAAMKAHLQAKQGERAGRVYRRILEALPPRRKEAWRKEHEWMTRIVFGDSDVKER